MARRRQISRGMLWPGLEPIGTGANWQLNTHMQALSGVKDYLNVVTGLTNRCQEQITHHEGMTIWNGYTMVDIGQGQGFFEAQVAHQHDEAEHQAQNTQNT